jgi:hypothetical protein
MQRVQGNGEGEGVRKIKTVSAVTVLAFLGNLVGRPNPYDSDTKADNATMALLNAELQLAPQGARPRKVYAKVNTTPKIEVRRKTEDGYKVIALIKRNATNDGLAFVKYSGQFHFVKHAGGDISRPYIEVT